MSPKFAMPLPEEAQDILRVAFWESQRWGVRDPHCEGLTTRQLEERNKILNRAIKEVKARWPGAFR